MERDELVEIGRRILELIGENPERPGVKETPERWASVFLEMTKGLREEEPELKVFDAEYEISKNDLIAVKNINFSSVCEHHLLPIIGKVSVVYAPKDSKVIGLSKIPRLVKWLAKRPILQERFTAVIADKIMATGAARGVYVLVRAKHYCVVARGVEDAEIEMVTEAVRGDMGGDLLERARRLVS